MADQEVATNMTPGYFDKDGYWISPRSKCCNTSIATYLKSINRYVQYYGRGDIDPVDLRCRACNRGVFVEPKQ